MEGKVGKNVKMIFFYKVVNIMYKSVAAKMLPRNAPVITRRISTE